MEKNWKKIAETTAAMEGQISTKEGNLEVVKKTDNNVN